MFEFVGKSFLSECVSVLWTNVILHSWTVVYDHNTVQIHVRKLRSRKRVGNVTNRLLMNASGHA